MTDHEAALREARRPLVDSDGNVNHERLGEIEHIAYAGELTYAEAGQMLRECAKGIKTLVVLRAADRALAATPSPETVPMASTEYFDSLVAAATPSPQPEAALREAAEAVIALIPVASIEPVTRWQRNTEARKEAAIAALRAALGATPSPALDVERLADELQRYMDGYYGYSITARYLAIAINAALSEPDR